MTTRKNKSSYSVHLALVTISPERYAFFSLPSRSIEIIFIQDRSLFLASEITLFFRDLLLHNLFSAFNGSFDKLFLNKGRRESRAPELQKICFMALKSLDILRLGCNATVHVSFALTLSPLCQQVQPMTILALFLFSKETFCKKRKKTLPKAKQTQEQSCSLECSTQSRTQNPTLLYLVWLL